VLYGNNRFGGFDWNGALGCTEERQRWYDCTGWPVGEYCHLKLWRSSIIKKPW